MKNVYFVILSGGSGTRLWPLSRKNKPKQLIPFLNNKSLLEETIDRITPLAINKNNIGIITTKEQAKLISQKLKNKIGFILQEPVARNTGPAILYSCFEIKKKDPNAIILFLSADHFIPEKNEYLDSLKLAIEYVKEHNNIVTLGLMPTFPATGYGYIQVNCPTKINTKAIYPVKKFHEKPILEKAQQYFIRNDMFWNLGMFIGKVKIFIKEYKQLAQQIYSNVSDYVKTSNENSYKTIQAISIDYAIMEKSSNISLLPCNFEWHDVGNLNTFVSLQQKYNKQINNPIFIDSKNNIARSSKQVVFIGIDNICLVEDNDVIIVSNRNNVEKVKEAMKQYESKTF